ncbi:MAG: ShlB/FhaC/HecB family hemolysin secretion/activation protein [Oscillatoriales cyanobacterium]|nr:MAG: ShlB/FhaC/HecB family hemolysin secretion/activation protein [Oscillatoriales cyanobacterium]
MPLLIWNGSPVLTQRSPECAGCLLDRVSQRLNQRLSLNQRLNQHLNRRLRGWLLGGLLLMVAGPGSGVAIAQTPLVPRPDRLPTEPSLPEALPRLDPLLPPPDRDRPETPPDNLPEIPGTISVKAFRVTGSTVFSAEEFAQLLAPYTNRPLTFAELLAARSAVTQLYVEQGYSTSGAFLPPQSIDPNHGVVEIRVLEGRLEAIEIQGLRRLREGYVRSRLERATQPPLQVDRLLDALQLLQVDPLIETVSAELSAGLEPGTNLLRVSLTESDTLHGDLSVDNGRSPSVGTVRRRGIVTQANLLGFGDSFSLGYTNTEGSDTIETNYTLPINSRNGTIGARFQWTGSNIIEDPFTPLDIQADSYQYELTYRQPLAQSPTDEVVMGLTLSHLDSQTSLLGVDFPLSPGADDDGRTSVTALRWFQEWTSRRDRAVLALRSQLSLGLDALGSTINRESPDSQFLSWRGQAQWVRVFAPDTLLLVRGDLQWADRPLLSVEQFGLGGFESVRGYRQDTLLTDSGLLGSAEFRLPLFRAPKIRGVMQIVPFVDFGMGWNRGDRPDPDPSTLVGAGVGLRWQQGDRFTARLDYAIPLVEVDRGDTNTWQENGLYFSVQWRAF